MRLQTCRGYSMSMCSAHRNQWHANWTPDRLDAIVAAMREAGFSPTTDGTCIDRLDWGRRENDIYRKAVLITGQGIPTQSDVDRGIWPYPLPERTTP